MVAPVTLGYLNALGLKILYGEINWAKTSLLQPEQRPTAKSMSLLCIQLLLVLPYTGQGHLTICLVSDSGRLEILYKPLCCTHEELDQRTTPVPLALQVPTKN